MAVAAMYLPLFTWLGKASGWILYVYWVLVSIAYTLYALTRLSHRLDEVET